MNLSKDTAMGPQRQRLHQNTNTEETNASEMEPFNDAYEDHDFEEILQLLDDGNKDLRRGGSRVGRGSNLDRKRELGAQRLYKDYLCENPTYPKHVFYRRFRVSRQISFKICNALEAKYPSFQIRKAVTGRVGFNVDQKRTAALRKMAYDLSADAVDEYFLMDKSTA